MFTDTHSHIYDDKYDISIDKIVENAKNNDVNKIIVAADTINACKEVIDISTGYDNVYFCLGIHPENIDEDINILEELIENNKDNPKFVAIGEIGLDYYWTKDTKDKQIELFRRQLDLATKYNKPVVVHSREATKDTIDILKEYNLKVDIHCFTGSLETMKIYDKMGCYFGVGGVMTFKNSNVKDVIKEIPMDKILFETDSPYLAPTPYRGKLNQPMYIKDIAKFYSELKNISLEEVSKISEENVRKFFNI